MVSVPPHLSTFADRLDQLKAARVLQSVEGHRVDASNGVIICACGDCDQESNYTSFLAASLHPRMHRCQLNGGPLSISDSSPLFTDCDDDGRELLVGAVMRRNLRNAVVLKDIKSVVFVAHVPCGAALLAQMSVDDVLRTLIAAKQDFVCRYKVQLDVRVACFLHVDWSMLVPEDGRAPRTYFVSRSLAAAWLESPPVLHPPPHFARSGRTPTFVG